MVNIGVISYGITTVSYAILSLLLLTSWRGRLQGALLVSASFMTMIWSLSVVNNAWQAYPASQFVPLVEIFRDVFWLFFLIRLLIPLESAQGGGRQFFLLKVIIVALTVVLAIMHILSMIGDIDVRSLWGVNMYLLGPLLYAIIGLVLIEQLFRNAKAEKRWAVKFLCLGLGGIFAYDFFLYSDALLFGRIDISFWEARGLLNALAVPLLAVAAARNPDWSLDVFVSRSIVFHTTALLGAGIYLMAMAVGGYYIRYYGGDWGVVGQVVFLFGAIIVLLLVLFSGQMRARLKVLLNKHFYNYKYDYREEWLRFINALSSEKQDLRLREKVVCAIADIVESPGGILWINNEGHFEPVAHYSMSEQDAKNIESSEPIIQFLENRGWVIDLDELPGNKEKYDGLDVPLMIKNMANAWLVVPLMEHERLLGVLVLERPRAPRSINWEDCDLLKTAGRQAASHLAQLDAAQALASARQFETFNRLSAFVVHDLKNLISQLSLVVSNAEKHKNNPAFIDDMIMTVDGSVAKINRLLDQLRAGRVWKNQAVTIELGQLLEEVVVEKSKGMPAPVLSKNENKCMVKAERDRLASIFGHIIQNAQDATPADGRIEISLLCKKDTGIVEIKDNGSGMDTQFIRERLFRPFDSTKGNTGMGIGAYESREFVRSLGGEIEVSSYPGEGTIFTIKLPLYDNERKDIKH